jgi:serine/threonine protein kinase
MAVVFLAWDRGLARHAAVKVLRPALSEDPAMARRFLQEGRTAAGLDAHPGVVRVYAAHEARGLRYLAMRYVDGCSLDALLRARGPLPPDLAADVVDQLARALHYAHARGVVHRDVKPANVLLARDGTAALTDFGIASAAANDTLGRGGSGLGTPAYMSPEHWRDEPLTPAGDQYALGVVAHQLAAGRLPFGGSLYAMQQAHLYEPPPALAEGDAGGALRAYAAVAARMLAKAPGDRFPSLGAVADALAAVPRDEPAVLRVRVGRLVRAVAAAAEQEVASPAANGRAPDTEAAPPDPARAAFLEAGTVPMPRAALRPDAEDAAEAHTPRRRR